MPQEESDAEVLSKLRENMETGRILAIVIGAGVSKGSKAPSMDDMHLYLTNKLKKVGGDEAQVIKTLLKALIPVDVDKSEPVRAGNPAKERIPQVNPRSVQVRLYSLLQKSDDKKIRDIWNNFGKDLIGLQDEMGNEEAGLLFDLPTSGVHRKCAELALGGKAILISFNFDGLTRKAVDEVAKDILQVPDGRATGLIVSTPNEIRSVHTQQSEELSPMEANGQTGKWHPIPIIKFRGDVFHAECKNGECPEYKKTIPIYDLQKQKNDTGQNEKPQVNVADPSASTAKAQQMLKCPVCGSERELSISFPGVFDKEQDIDRALSAFHQIYGCSLAGIVFIGFSGRWDEALVDYLVGRASEDALDCPVIILDKAKKTPGITEFCERYGICNVHLIECISSTQDISQESILHRLSVNDKSDYMPSDPRQSIEFPEEGKILLGIEGTNNDYSLKLTPASKELILKFKGKQLIQSLIAKSLEFKQIKDLRHCSQLGLKRYLIGGNSDNHTRFHHSVATAMVSSLWYEALVPQAAKYRNWSCTNEARLALELAVLFHDARHVPFSHMMEEVFAELNWGYKPLPIAPDIAVQSSNDIFPENTEIVKLRDVIGGIDPIKLQNKAKILQFGRSGVPWLQAIVDSAVDADKIEYIFHDTQLTGQNVRLSDWKTWFLSFLSGQSLTREGLIRLEGESSVAFFELLQERQHLYRKLYLTPELRAFECMARYIVITWLDWEVPHRISLKDNSMPTENLRGLNSETAGEILWEIFKSDDGNSEKKALEKIVKELSDSHGDHLDKEALDWIKLLQKKISIVCEVASVGKPSLQGAREKFLKMQPHGPFYIHRNYEKHVRNIIRLWRTHYPLTALVDVTSFPKFLATPANRRTKIAGGSESVAEQFLVPDRHPAQWGRKRKATVPLHDCDVSAYEHNALQLLIFDPAESSRSSDFVHQMLRRELQRASIPIAETPDAVIYRK